MSLTDTRHLLEKRNPVEGVIFIAKVTFNKDPEKRGRVRIYIPDYLGEDGDEEYNPWALPANIPAYRVEKTNDESYAHVPPKDSWVYVTFQQGDPHYPMYWGGANIQATDELAENYPDRIGFRDIKKNYYWNDTKTDEMEFFHHSGLKVHIDADGTVTIDAPVDFNLNVKGDVNLVVDGDLNATAKGDAVVNVEGNATLSVTGDLSLTVQGDTTIQAENLSLTATDLTFDVSGLLTMNAEVEINGSLKVNGVPVP